ncbi:MAG: sigma-70 family RNA polymerase sigma factor [Myxococcota bacterium]|nr:sigma-70 family RNA polymerase sigma factor [Myxococcota bacterium]
MAELGVAFLSRLPVEHRGDVTELELQLAALVARARSEASGIDLDPLAFVAHVAERVTFDAQGAPLLAPIYAGDLWIAFGCVVQHAGALSLFETRYGPEIRNALRRSFEPALAEDAEVKLLNKLLLVAPDEAPRLASYAGRGALGPWLRASAVRTAIDLMRARRELPVDPGTLDDAAAIDPLLASLKERYRDEFRGAFAAAAAQLTERDRALLRYRFFDDLSIDEIGVLYRVHRATVARWIATVRESLFEATRAQLMRGLAVSESEVDSVLRLIDSQLDFSIEAVMR